MPRWIYAPSGLTALTIALGSGDFVGEHLLYVHTFGWPLLSDAGLSVLCVTCAGGFFAAALAIRKLIALSSGTGAR